MSPELILATLLVIAASFEAVLFVMRDFLLGAQRIQSLEGQLNQAQADLKEGRKRVEERRRRLHAAIEALERVRAADEEIDKQAEAAQQVKPILIHTAGPPGTGKRFRAPLKKDLPAQAEPLQKLIWSYDNYVEVWTGDLAAAEETVHRDYGADNGFDVGRLVAVETEMQHA